MVSAQDVLSVGQATQRPRGKPARNEIGERKLLP